MTVIAAPHPADTCDHGPGEPSAPVAAMGTALVLWRAPITVVSRPAPDSRPRCACGMWYPAATLEEAQVLRAAHTATTGAAADVEDTEYFTCRTGAWHSIDAVTEATCPCARPAYATAEDRNRAGRAASAIHGTDTVRARYFTCRHGGYHWTWGVEATKAKPKHCRCGSVRFSAETDAELVAEYYRTRFPEADVEVYRCWRPRWHVRVRGAGEGELQHPQPPVYSRCACGKAASATKEEARSLHERIGAHTGADQAPVRFYSCRHGSWHWTQHVAYEICTCGETAFADRADAIKAAHAAWRRYRPETLTTRAYLCRHGSHHWSWFPKHTDITTCFCAQVNHPDEAAARAVAAFRAEHFPDIDWQVRLCRGGWHVLRKTKRRPVRTGPSPATIAAAIHAATTPRTPAPASAVLDAVVLLADPDLTA